MFYTIQLIVARRSKSNLIKSDNNAHKIHFEFKPSLKKGFNNIISKLMLIEEPCLLPIKDTLVDFEKRAG